MEPGMEATACACELLYVYINRVVDLSTICVISCCQYLLAGLQQCSLATSATVVSAEPFSDGTATLRCLQKKMATYRH